MLLPRSLVRWTPCWRWLAVSLNVTKPSKHGSCYRYMSYSLVLIMYFNGLVFLRCVRQGYEFITSLLLRQNNLFMHANIHTCTLVLQIQCNQYDNSSQQDITTGYIECQCIIFSSYTCVYQPWVELREIFFIALSCRGQENSNP